MAGGSRRRKGISSLSRGWLSSTWGRTTPKGRRQRRTGSHTRPHSGMQRVAGSPRASTREEAIGPKIGRRRRRGRSRGRTRRVASKIRRRRVSKELGGLIALGRESTIGPRVDARKRRGRSRNQPRWTPASTEWMHIGRELGQLIKHRSASPIGTRKPIIHGTRKKDGGG
eukprot:2647114-Heterocapsa_arctica.AAC.1